MGFHGKKGIKNLEGLFRALGRLMPPAVRTIQIPHGPHRHGHPNKDMEVDRAHGRSHDDGTELDTPHMHINKVDTIK